MIWPIFIPSKGRAGKSKLIDSLLADDLPFHVVVENQDFEAYKTAWPKAQFLVLMNEDQGIAYVRNEILMTARLHKLKWYWMFDDDISNFYVIRSRKAIKTPVREILYKAQELISKQQGVAQAGLEYQQFAWSQEHPIKFNSYCDVAVAVNAEHLKTIKYRAHMNLKEDRDFTLQVLSMGFKTMRCEHLAFAAPKNGSNAGGLQETYEQVGKEAAASQRMCEAWPGICTPITKKDGRKDVKINWKIFRNQ